MGLDKGNVQRTCQLFCTKTYLVDTHWNCSEYPQDVLMPKQKKKKKNPISTHNICFRAKIIKLYNA